MKNIKTKQLRIARSRKSLTNPSKRFIARLYKSNLYDYVQILHPETGNVVFSISTKKIEGKNRSQKAQKLGEQTAAMLTQKKIKSIVLDKSGYKYHGRIKILADEMRKNGINF